MKNLGTGKMVLIIVVILVIVAIAWSLSSDSEITTPGEEPGKEEMVTDNNDVAGDLGRRDGGGDFNDVGGNDGESAPGVEAGNDSPRDMGQDIVFVGDVLAGTTSPLIDFNEADYSKALASDKLVMLYFYANWCPTCKKEESTALNPAFNEITHAGVVGFRVNFNDDETDDFEKQLAREFGVTYQEAKVFIKNGEVVHQVPNPWSKDEYIENINNLI